MIFFKIKNIIFKLIHREKLIYEEQLFQNSLLTPTGFMKIHQSSRLHEIISKIKKDHI